MFNFKSKVAKITQSVKQSFETPRDPQAVIAEIHQSFDTASEKLLNDARKILAGSYDIEKGERLKSIGFTQAKKAVEASNIVSEKQKNQELAKLIEYYQMYYPNNKFITEGKTKEICQKYGLLCAKTEYYTGDVPEKNLSEIEKFKLREDDMIKNECGWVDWASGRYKLNKNKPTDVYSEYGYIMNPDMPSFWSTSATLVKVKEDVKFVYTKMSLKICASLKDFNTKNMNIEDGYKLELNLPDPIVLQPVNGGYLVVSKWGLEAEDGDLVNEKMN